MWDMPTYTLSDLSKLANVTPRTIRYYITQGLLPSPSQQGPSTRYEETHLALLRVIKKLQNAHLPLAEIRARLRTITDEQMATITSSTDAESPPDSAVDYIRQVMGQPPLPTMPPLPAAAFAAALASAPAPNEIVSRREADAERSQWERIPLDPDIELHVRRPLTRQHNKRVDRLITIARQLFEED